MGTQRFAGIGRAGRGAVALAVAVLAAIAGSGPAAAGAGSGGSDPPRDAAGAGVISTVAGGVGGPARATQVSLPTGNGLSACGVAFGAGRLYIANAQSVRAVNPVTDWLTTPAGTGYNSPLGDGGRAAAAGLHNACGAAVDQAGNLLIADASESRVRVAAASTGTFYGQCHDRRAHLHRRRQWQEGVRWATAAPPPAPNSGPRAGWRWTPPGTC